MLSIVGEVRPDIGKRREARGDEARGDEARGKRGRGERGWKVVARCTLHVGRFPNP